MSAPVERFWGKYRASVFNNVDPMMLGRIQVQVPAVLGEMPSSWALPCVPFAGKQQGVYVLPPIGASVWVEFEGGNPDRPIWTGCFWGDGETLPDALAQNPLFPSIVLQTGLGNKVVMSDIPGVGGIKLSSISGLSSIEITDTGVTIKCGAAVIKLDPVQVDVNNGALTVI